MSTPIRKPFLSDEDLIGYVTSNGVTLYTQHRMSPIEVRDKYEAHLAEKDALIQRVVDHWDKWQGKGCIEADMEFDDIVTDMNNAGFTPTHPTNE